jgi:hypothetical protein
MILCGEILQRETGVCFGLKKDAVLFSTRNIGPECRKEKSGRMIRVINK